MTEWSTEDEAKLKELRRRKAKILRDPTRKHEYAPRGKLSVVTETTKETIK